MVLWRTRQEGPALQERLQIWKFAEIFRILQKWLYFFSNTVGWVFGVIPYCPGHLPQGKCCAQGQERSRSSDMNTFGLREHWLRCSSWQGTRFSGSQVAEEGREGKSRCKTGAQISSSREIQWMTALNSSSLNRQLWNFTDIMVLPNSFPVSKDLQVIIESVLPFERFPKSRFILIGAIT